jgi:hypothetical protein
MIPKDFDAAVYLQSLTDEEWTRINDRLVNHAERFLRRYSWHTPTGLPTAREAEDVILLCWEKVYEDASRWKPWRQQATIPGEALLAYLRMAVERKLHNLADLYETRMRAPSEDALGRSVFDQIPNSCPSPEDELEEADLHRFSERVRGFAWRRGFGQLYDLYFLEELRPREIAPILGVRKALVFSRTAEMKKTIRRRFGLESRLHMAPA